MRNHGSIHLFIAGMIAVFLDVHAPTMLAAQAKPLIKVTAGYGSTDGAIAPLWFAKETSYSKNAASMCVLSAWAPVRRPCAR